MKTIEKLEKRYREFLELLNTCRTAVTDEDIQFWYDVNDAIRLGKQKNGILNRGTLKDIFIEFVKLITSTPENFEIIDSWGPDTGNYIHFFNVHISDRGMSLSALEKIKRFCDAKDIFVSGGNIDPWVITYEVIYDYEEMEEPTEHNNKKNLTTSPSECDLISSVATSDKNPNCILPFKYEELLEKYKLNYNLTKDELQIYTKTLDLQFLKELKHMMVENFAIEISAVFYNDYKITIKLEKFTRYDPHD